MKKKKGMVFITSMMLLATLMVLMGTYLSSLQTELKSSIIEEASLQALGLAEAGANHSLSELRERIRTDLESRVAPVSQSQLFNNYVTSADSLGFLRDYAYAPGDAQFTVSLNQARLTLGALNMNTGVPGDYTAIITVEANGNPTNPSGEIYVFPYKYSIRSSGTVSKGSVPDLTETVELLGGSFDLTVRRDTFAKYALFTSHHRTSSGTTVWFTGDTNFNGPIFTNERLSFANNPSGHFSEDVGQHLSTARFYNRGWSRLLDTDSNPPYDVPVFETNFNRGEDLINLESSISQTELRRQALGGISEPSTDGIYLPNDGVNVVGGIYVRGNQGRSSDNASINMSIDANDNSVYTISQGAAAASVITVDSVNNQTTLQDQTGNHVYNGLPNGINNEGILFYVNDDIGGLAGTVQRDTQMTVSSERDIVISNNILYQDYTASPLSAEGYPNTLGILSWGGDVRIGTSAPDNVNIHGVIMAPHGVFSVDNYTAGSPRGTATLLGGVITEFYGAFGTFRGGSGQVSGYGRNFVYDGRMLEGTAPPYFPYMTNFTSFEDGLGNQLTWNGGN